MATHVRRSYGTIRSVCAERSAGYGDSDNIPAATICARMAAPNGIIAPQMSPVAHTVKVVTSDHTQLGIPRNIACNGQVESSIRFTPNWRK